MTIDPQNDVWFLLGLAILFATLSVASSLIAINMQHGF